MQNEVDTKIHAGREDESIIALPTTRILVVDDDNLLREFLKDVLISGEYTHVDLAADAKEALELLKVNQYHVVLSDVNMPGMDGFELLDYLRTYYGATAVLMITGKPELASAVEAVKKGACDYLPKPISPEKLLDAVKLALQRQREQQAMINVPAVPASRLAQEYRVIRSLGSGSMGVVLLVEKDGKNYAMKLLRQDGREEQLKTQKERFLREGRLLAQIDHPCIVKIYENGIPEEGEDGSPYIVMEFVPGHPLDQLIKKKTLASQDKIAIVSQIASALAEVHRHGIMHRDVKPANVLVTKGMHAKLTDFGVARIDDSELTLTAEMIGSPAYMAPECFEKHRTETDGRADIFSLGVIAYEMFSGLRPFSGKNFADLAQSIRTAKPIAPRAINPEIPEDVESILARMLAKNPIDRFQSAKEIVSAINQMKAGTLIRALKTDIGLRSIIRAIRPQKTWQ